MGHRLPNDAFIHVYISTSDDGGLIMRIDLPKVLNEIYDITPPTGHVTVIAGERNGSSYQWDMPIVEKRDKRRKTHYGACENNLLSMIEAVQDFMDQHVLYPVFEHKVFTNDETRFNDWHVVINTGTSVISLEIGELKESTIDLGDLCVHCGNSTAFGSGRFVDRYPVFGLERDGDGIEYTGYCCNECELGF